MIENIRGSNWLLVWTWSIHDIAIEGNFADTHTLRNDGTNIAMIDNRIFPPGEPPPAARDIIDAAGVSPAYNRWASPR